jgi:hypothetical protein
VVGALKTKGNPDPLAPVANVGALKIPLGQAFSVLLSEHGMDARYLARDKSFAQRFEPVLIDRLCKTGE